MEIKKEFYLPNKSVLSLYNISYLEEDFNLVTDKISNSLGNRKVDINGNLLMSNRFYLGEDPILKPLTSINYGHEIISFDKVDAFIRENNNPKYLKVLEEYLQIFNFEYKENYIKEKIIKEALEELEKNRDFCKVERYLDQKYFLEVALENDYKRKVQMAKANLRVLRLGNRSIL